MTNIVEFKKDKHNDIADMFVDAIDSEMDAAIVVGRKGDDIIIYSSDVSSLPEMVGFIEVAKTHILDTW